MLKIKECRKFMKACSKCKKLKLVKGNFGKNKRKKDGIDIYCKECRHINSTKKHICKNCGQIYLTEEILEVFQNILGRNQVKIDET